jgi:hypothetical protein
MKLVLQILCILIFLVLASSALAMNLYTSSTGSDTGNNCQNITSPCDLTNGIEHELSHVTAANGDILYLCAGACDGSGAAVVATSYYQAYASVGIPNGTSWANAFTIKPYTGETITFQPASGGLIFETYHLSYFIMDGCPGEPDSACTPRIILDGINLTSTAEAILSIGAGNHQRFRGLEIKNGFWTGVDGGNDSTTAQSYIQIYANKIHDNGRCTVCNPPHGIYLTGQSSVGDGVDTHDEIAYNDIYNQHNHAQAVNSAGFVCYTGETYSVLQGLSIHHNKIHDNDTAIQITAACPNALIYNNLIYGNNQLSAVLVDANNTQVYNNTIVNNPGWYGIWNYGHSNSVFKNNILYNNNPNWNNTGTTPTCSNNMGVNSRCAPASSSDPLLVNPKSNDFHLQSTSPAIGAGANLSSIFTVDHDGVARPSSPSAWDIGAFQKNGSAPSPVSPPGNLRIAVTR